MPNYYYTNRPRSESPSKRWSTTTRSALEEVAGQLKYDRDDMVKKLQDRKLANTKTSISFGNDRTSYLSDSMDNQIRCTGYISPEERAQTQQRIKNMKTELTTTNFKLGDEQPVYESINHQAMAKAETFCGTQRVGMNSSLKEAVKKSSIYFGNEPVVYETVAHDSMQYRGNQNNFTKLKNEVTTMKASLRKHNFSFGDETVEYVSDYHRGYSSIPKEAYSNSKEKKVAMKGIIEDSRRCHFSLGNDHPHYLSNTHSALRTVEGQTTSDVQQGIERAKQMKAELQRTSIVIGDDQEYY